jgi:hypothetical protein
VRIAPQVLASQEISRGLKSKAAALLGAETAQSLWDVTQATEALSAREFAALLRG